MIATLFNFDWYNLNMKKFISIISPAWNVNEYLPKFLESFKNWPQENYEVIIVNDCSPEDPKPVLDKYEGVVNIKYVVNKKNLGLGFSRNVAFDNMDKKATHYMILDSDNYLVDDAWEIVNKAMKDKIVLTSKLFVVDAVTGKISKKKNRGKLTFLKGSGFVGPECNIIPRKCLDVRFTARSMEDLRWMSELTSKYDFEVLDEGIIMYLKRDGSLSMQKIGSKEHVQGIEDYFSELKLANSKGLLIKNADFKNFIKDLYIKYFYSKSKYRKNDLFFIGEAGLKYYELKTVAFFQKIVRFWWWDKKINSFIARKKWDK